MKSGLNFKLCMSSENEKVNWATVSKLVLIDLVDDGSFSLAICLIDSQGG